MSGATPAVRRDAPVDNVDDVDGIDNQLLEVAEHALACARQHGADMSEVAVGIDRGVSVTARNREMETIEHHRDNSLAVSVYFDHRSGAAASADFSADAIAKSVAQACAIAKFTERDECNGLADRARLAEKFPGAGFIFSASTGHRRFACARCAVRKRGVGLSRRHHQQRRRDRIVASGIFVVRQLA